MADRNAYYVVVDVCPVLESNAFREYAGATVGCWVRNDLVKSEDEIQRIIEKNLSDTSWCISRILLTEIVSSETYKDKQEGREMFEQALTDEFVANFHLRRREIIDIDNNNLRNVFIVECYKGFVNKLKRDGGYSLYSNNDRQWANGVSPDGDEFFPIWTNKNEIKRWLEYWPEYEIRKLDTKELCDSLLTDINECEMWVALGLSENILVTSHPIGLQRSLNKPEILIPA